MTDSDGDPPPPPPPPPDDPHSRRLPDAGGLGHLIEQLWSPILASDRIRIHAGADDPDWIDLERYLVLPSLDKATMLLPADTRQVLAGSLLNFRRLRAPATRLQRSVLGRASTLGMPLPFPVVRLQARAGRGERPLSPTEQIALDLGVGPLHAAIGVRTGGNRKATLQLVHDDGSPAGFAKFSWEALSDRGLQREAAALAAIRGGTEATGVPRLLTQGSWHDWHYLVTEPLPGSSRRLRRFDLPSAQEIFAFCPIVRSDQVQSTRQFNDLRCRVSAHAARRSEVQLAESTLELLNRVAETEVPVAARWHGDFTPWNSCRDDRGKLWCWDWESSEVDVVAGLDAIHWAATTRTQLGDRYGERLLRDSVVAATPTLVAAGHSPLGRDAAVALYVASLVERAIDVADAHGAWAEEWLRHDEVVELLVAAHSTLSD